MTLRRILFWAHLLTGSVVGLVVGVMCVTGIGLAFERQINQMADEVSRAKVAPGSVRRPLDELMKGLPESGERVSNVTVFADPSQPVTFAFGRERNVFVDPYSGRVVGEGSRTSRTTFAVLERWHRALGGELRGRGPGRGIADAATVLFVFLIVSGFVLWWPRKWGLAQLTAVTMFRSNLSGRAALWNLHNVVGIWCLLPLLLVSVTGVVMAYPWATNLLYRATGSAPPSAVREENREQHEHNRRVADHTEAVDWQKLFERAERQVPAWRSVSLRWAPRSAEAVFTIDEGNGGQPQKRSQLTLDKATGDVRRWEPFGSYSAGRRLRAWARFVHTGEAGGIWGEVIAALAALGGCLLVGSGLSMAWIRFNRKLTSRRVSPAQFESVSR